MMSKDQAARWIIQELAKVTSCEMAIKRIENFKLSQGFFNSPEGIKIGKKEPHARQAQIDLINEIAKKFNISI